MAACDHDPGPATTAARDHDRRPATTAARDHHDGRGRTIAPFDGKEAVLSLAPLSHGSVAA